MNPTDTHGSKRGPKPSPLLRDAMLKAAVSLFSEHGIDATTTREIASRAGTTERTLFKHFGSKELLVSTVLNDAVIDSMRTMRFSRIMDDTPFTPDEFRAWHQGFLMERIDGASAAPENYRILFRELLRDTTLARQFSDNWHARVFLPLAAHLSRLQEAGLASRRHTPEALAAAFYSFNISYLLTRFALKAVPTGWNSADDARTVVGLFASLCDWDSGPLTADAPRAT